MDVGHMKQKYSGALHPSISFCPGNETNRQMYTFVLLDIFRTLPFRFGMVWHLVDFTRRFLHKQCLVVEAWHSESGVYFSLIVTTNTVVCLSVWCFVWVVLVGLCLYVYIRYHT